MSKTVEQIRRASFRRPSQKNTFSQKRSPVEQFVFRWAKLPGCLFFSDGDFCIVRWAHVVPVGWLSWRKNVSWHVALWKGVEGDWFFFLKQSKVPQTFFDKINPIVLVTSGITYYVYQTQLREDWKSENACKSISIILALSFPVSSSLCLG